MTAFQPELLAADFAQVRRVLADFVAARSPEDWGRKTERRAKGWTLHQTLAHLVATAEVIHRATEDTLRGLPVSFPLSRRTELAAFNERSITERLHISPRNLGETLVAVLERCAERCPSLSPRELALTIPAPFYNRPLAVAEALGWQLIHPGMVHAAQLANGAGVAPLWIYYPPELMHRQITRLLSIMSHSYWPERGGDLRASINFTVSGPGGGRWRMTVDPEGGSTDEGAATRPALTVWTPSAHALCQLLMIQVSPVGALMRGQMLAWGNLGLGFKIPYLFIPT